MWGFHADELSDWAIGEVYAAGARFVDERGKLQVKFLKFLEIPEDHVADMFDESTLKLYANASGCSSGADDLAVAGLEERPAKKMKSQIVYEVCKAQYPLETCMVTGSDGAAIMLGCHNGIMTRSDQHMFIVFFILFEIRTVMLLCYGQHRTIVIIVLFF